MVSITKVVSALRRVQGDSAGPDDALLLAEYISALLLQLYNIAPDGHQRAAYASALMALRALVGDESK